MNPLTVQLLLIATMAVWGINISFIKILTQHLDPMVVATWRMVLAAVVINFTLRGAKQHLNLKAIEAKHWLRFVACAGLMVYGNQVFFTGGMQTAQATNASLIMALSPLVASLMAAAIFRERITGLRMLGIVLGFGGVFAVVLNQPGAELSTGSWGDVLILCAMASFVAGGILIQALARQFGSLIISCIIYTLGAAMLCAHMIIQGEFIAGILQLLQASAATGLLLLASGVVATAICNMFWNRSIGELGAARVSLYQYWIPVFGVGFALLWLGEPFSWWHLAGLVSILVGTYLGTRRQL